MVPEQENNIFYFTTINVECAAIFALVIWSLLRPPMTGVRGNGKENRWKKREDDVQSCALV